MVIKITSFGLHIYTYSKAINVRLYPTIQDYVPKISKSLNFISNHLWNIYIHKNIIKR